MLFRSEYGYLDACAAFDSLVKLARAVEIPEMVKLMKATVPEYKSNNSVFEKFDK